jgi:Transposase DDE domain group 1
MPVPDCCSIWPTRSGCHRRCRRRWHPPSSVAVPHDRGEVLVDVAVMLADGGDTISDVAVLRDQPDLFGDVASHATVWRTLDAVDTITLERIKIARAQARAKAWTAGADPGFYVIDIDATLVGAHSEKEQAAPTYKRGFGFHRASSSSDAMTTKEVVMT